MLTTFGEGGVIILLGLLSGLALGLAARIGRFCTLGMIEDVHFGNDGGRAWMWAGALGVAMMGNFGLVALGVLELDGTLYLGNRLSLLGAILGGLIFGYGMAQAGNCGFGTLARIGGGDLRALVIALTMGIAALATVSGVLAAPRVLIFPTTPSPDIAQGYAHLAARATGLHVAWIALPIGAAFFALSVRQQAAERRAARAFWSTVVGLAVTAGFAGTYWMSQTGFEPWPVVSHTFTAPVGDTIHYVMFYSGLAPKFGIGSVLGVVLGGAIGALLRDEVRWEACDDARQLRRQMAGGMLMGVGAVLAAGCSFGQGMTGLSTLGFTAPVAAAAIWIGAWIGLRQLIFGVARSL